MKKICICLIMVLCSTLSMAQQYRLQIGGRMETTFGPGRTYTSSGSISVGSFFRTYSTEPQNSPLSISENVIINTFTTITLSERSNFNSLDPFQNPPVTSSNVSMDYNLTEAIAMRILTAQSRIFGNTRVTAQIIPIIRNINRAPTSNGQPTNEVCQGGRLTLRAFREGDANRFPNVAYNWQYSTNGTNWNDFPVAYNRRPQVTATMEEIIGPTHVNFINQNIQFRIGGYGKGSFMENDTDILTIRYDACAPLVTGVRYVPPQCAGGTFNVVVTFDRPFNTGVNEQFSSISLVDINNSSINLEQRTRVGMTGSNSYTFANINPGNRYVDGQTLAIRYQTEQNGVITPVVITSTQNFTYTSITPVRYTSSSTDISCTSGQGPDANGSITIGASGGTPPYAYQLNSEGWVSFTGTSVTVANRGAGMATIQVRDRNLCPGTPQSPTMNEVTIRQPTAITIAKTNETNATFSGGSNGRATATVTGGTPTAAGIYTYQWTNAMGTVVTGGSARVRNAPRRYEIDLPDISEGTYTLRITDTRNCSITETFTIGSPTLVSFLTEEAIAIRCGDTDPNNNDGRINALATGGIPPYLYQLLERDAGGSFVPLGAARRLNTGEAFQVNGLSQGTYRVEVLDNIDDPGNTNPVRTSIDLTVNEPDVFRFENIRSEDADCAGEASGSITLNILGGNRTYQISLTNASAPSTNRTLPGIANNSIDYTISNLRAGTYTLTATDENNCTVVTSLLDRIVTIDEPDPIAISKANETPATFSGGSNGRATAVVTGGTPATDGSYLYQWTNSLGATVAGGTATILTSPNRYQIDLPNLPNDTYTLRIEDAEGCDDTIDFRIQEPLPIVFETPELTPVSCGDADATNDNGSIRVRVTGGLPPYSYQLVLENSAGVFEPIQAPQILNAGEVFERTNLSKGTYRVQVLDNINAVVNTNPTRTSSDMIIEEPDPLQIQDISTMDAICIGEASGSIMLDVLGGNGTYTIELMNAENPEANQTIPGVPHNAIAYQIPNVVGEGTYTIQVTDEKGCTAVTPLQERTTTVGEPDPILVDLGPRTVICKDQTHTLDATINDPLASYRWSLDTDPSFTATTPVVTVNATGTYTATVTSGLGCEHQGSVEIISLNDAIGAEFVISSDVFVGESYIVVNVSNPIPDRVSWLFPDTISVIEENEQFIEIQFPETGTYTLQMETHIGECIASFTKTITVRERSFAAASDSEREGLQTYAIAPNPSRGNFSVELAFDTETAIDMRLFSTATNTLLYRHQEANAATYSIPFSLQNTLPSGLYLLVLETPGRSYVRKIIIE